MRIKVQNNENYEVGTVLQVISVNRQTNEVIVIFDTTDFFHPYCLHNYNPITYLCMICRKD